MSLKNMKKVSRTLVITMMLSLFLFPSISAQGIVLDGDIIESEWVLWFNDDSWDPEYTVYYAGDEDYVYLGIVVDDNDVSDDHLRLAYRADDIDYLIKIKHEIISYRPSGGSYEDWWDHSIWGTPPGVEAAIGSTNGMTSYEFSNTKDELGDYADDFPNNFVMWIMYITDNPEGEANYYPESRAGWWFITELDEENDDKPTVPDLTPTFAIPEVPFGTILSLATMAGVLLLLTKRNKPVQL